MGKWTEHFPPEVRGELKERAERLFRAYELWDEVQQQRGGTAHSGVIHQVNRLLSLATSLPKWITDEESDDQSLYREMRQEYAIRIAEIVTGREL